MLHGKIKEFWLFRKIVILRQPKVSEECTALIFWAKE
jgi:hypothetical protein